MTLIVPVADLAALRGMLDRMEATPPALDEFDCARIHSAKLELLVGNASALLSEVAKFRHRAGECTCAVEHASCLYLREITTPAIRS